MGNKQKLFKANQLAGEAVNLYRMGERVDCFKLWEQSKVLIASYLGFTYEV